MIKMRFEGGEQLAKALDGMPKRMSRSVQRDALEIGADPIMARAQATAPREPGAPDVADNIRISRDVRPKDGSVAVGIGVSRGFFYDWFNEFGTAKQPAKPFWRPALDGEKERSLKLIAGEMWSAIISRGFGSGRGSGGGVGL